MKTLAITTIGAAPARQSGNAAHALLKGFFRFSLASLIGMILWAVQVQVTKRNWETEGPKFILTNLESGNVSTCKIVSIEKSVESSHLRIRIVGLLSDLRWQKEGLILILENSDDKRFNLKVEEIVLVSHNATGQITIEPLGHEFGLLIEHAQKELIEMSIKDPKAFGKIIEKYKQNMEQAIYNRRNHSFEASNRRSDFRTGGVSLTTVRLDITLTGR